MSRNVADIDKTHAQLEAESRRYLGNGIAWSSLLYVAMGLFMIVISRIWNTLPLNTPAIFQVLGNWEQAIWVRWMSIAFFAIAGLVLLSGLLYSNRAGDKKTIAVAKVVAFIQQPWIAFALIAIAGVWLYIIIDAGKEGDFAAFFAGLSNVDLGDKALKYDFIWKMQKLPILPFLMFGVFSIGIYPFTMYSSAITLQDTGMVLNKKRLVHPMPQEQRARMYAVKGLFTASLFYLLIGVAIWGIGLARALGVDAFYPIIAVETYPMWLNVYWIFPVAFAACCMVTSIWYYVKPAAPTARALAWYCGFVQMLVPVIGWFFGITLMMNLRASAKDVEPKTTRRCMFYGFSAAVFSVIVPLFVFWMVALNRVHPGNFGFAIDPNNLEAQVNGLVWTATLVLVLFYFLIGFYLIMESLSAEIAAKKSFQRGLAFLFICLGIVELVVILYSVFNKMGIKILPDMIPAPAEVRGDNSTMFLFAGLAVTYIVYCIERFLKNSKHMAVTIVVVAMALAGVAGLVFSFIPAINGAEWYQIGGYVFMGLPGIGLLLGVLMILVTYSQLAAQTSGVIKKSALTILFGFLITVASALMHVLRNQIAEFPFNWLVFIVLNIIGMLIYMQGILRASY
jgi:hypothetical protein